VAEANAQVIEAEEWRVRVRGSGEAHRDGHHDEIFLYYQSPEQGSTEVDPNEAGSAQDAGQLVPNGNATVWTTLVHGASRTTIRSVKGGGIGILRPVRGETRGWRGDTRKDQRAPAAVVPEPTAAELLSPSSGSGGLSGADLPPPSCRTPPPPRPEP